MANKLFKVTKSKTNTLTSKIKKTSKSKHKRILFLLIFGVIGGTVLMISQAAGFSIGMEPENIQSNDHYTVGSDSGASGGRFIQFGNGSHGSGGGCADGPNFRSMNICINPASIPGPSHTPTNQFLTAPTQDIRTTLTPSNNHLTAATRFDCGYTHVSRNDPIVYPGQKDAAHWHVFSGNADIDENTVNPVNFGRSNCHGGALNRTGYWAPMLVDTNSYNPTTKQFDMAKPMTERDSCNPSSCGGDGFNGGYFMQVYYKAGYSGPVAKDIQWFPPGLKMIAGANAGSQPTGPPDSRYVWFDCTYSGNTGHVWGEEGIDYHASKIPSRCPPNYYIQATVTFPQCGKRDNNGNPVLDSPDHREHMSYGLGWPNLGCPSTHPIAYPSIEEHFRWRVPATGAAGLRFSSDVYANAEPGWTFHADWMNGWNQTTSQDIINTCFRGGPYNYGYDCRVDQYGETQLMPPQKN
jgi:hypothetical protein